MEERGLPKGGEERNTIITDYTTTPDPPLPLTSRSFKHSSCHGNRSVGSSSAVQHNRTQLVNYHHSF